MNNKELCDVCGGGINGTILNALSRLANTILEVGRAVGSAISRYLSGSKC